MSPAIKCLILLAVIALFFVTEIIPLAITAIGGAVAWLVGSDSGQAGFQRSL